MNSCLAQQVVELLVGRIRHNLDIVTNLFEVGIAAGNDKAHIRAEWGDLLHNEECHSVILIYRQIAVIQHKRLSIANH